MTVRTQPDAVPPTALVPPCALAGLWAVRHGQSTANVAFAAAEESGATGPVPGRDRDVPLSALGVAQAVALGDWLAGQAAEAGPDLVVCSPYTRASQTWEGMAARAVGLGGPRLDVLVDERLRDREMGVFELHPPTALRARAPQEADRRELIGEWCYRPPGGEALTDVAVRVGQFIRPRTGRARAAGPGRRTRRGDHRPASRPRRNRRRRARATATGPERLGVALERRRRPAASGRLGRHRPPDLAGRRGGNEAHLNDRSPADSIPARVGPVPAARTHTRSTRRSSPTGRRSPVEGLREKQKTVTTARSADLLSPPQRCRAQG